MGLYTVLMVIHSVIVLFLILMVLIQRTDSDGMGGLGGGGGGNQFLTGRATANLMTRTTAILAAGFMISSLLLAILANHMTSKSIIDAVSVEDQDKLAKDAMTSEGAKDTAVEVISTKDKDVDKKSTPLAKDAVKELEDKIDTSAAKKKTAPVVEKKEAPSVPKPE